MNDTKKKTRKEPKRVPFPTPDEFKAGIMRAAKKKRHMAEIMRLEKQQAAIADDYE